jgi:hyperosmotically inducible protein
MNSATLLRSAALAVGLALLAVPVLADQPDDAWITSKVKAALLTDDLVDGLDINVDTFDGRVTLHGQVSSEAEKTKAEVRAREIEGVADVRNLLAIVPDGERDRTEMLDEAVDAGVEAAIEGDRALAGSTIEVKSVNKGVVVLAGEAKTLSAEARAIATARRVSGVRQVVSEIQGPDDLSDREVWQEEDGIAEVDAASDAWVTTKVKVKLMSAAGISPVRVNVDTSEGVVTLFGTVDSDADRTRAADEIRSIDGVRDVRNMLQVVPDVAASAVGANDDELSEAVRKRIADRQSLSDAKISVEAADGVVRLTGSVASQRDHLTALTLARGTTGVKSVIDDLELKRSGS